MDPTGSESLPLAESNERGATGFHYCGETENTPTADLEADLFTAQIKYVAP